MPQPVTQSPRPHPWTREIHLLLEQSLTFLRGHEVSVPALSRARYHQKQMVNEPPFYLRLFAGANIGDQITLRCSPADDLFKRRCSLNIHVKRLTEAAVQTALTGALSKQGVTQITAASPDPLLFSNRPKTLELFLFFKDEHASLRIQYA